MSNIVIVDLGFSNLSSIRNMLKRIGIKASTSSNKDEIYNAEKLVLPGVGSFDQAINQLTVLGLEEVLNIKVLEEKVPILGICLGAQIMTASSEEGKMKGLGWIRAKTISFDQNKFNESKRIPHMGWEDLEISSRSPLFQDFEEHPRFYFLHSFHFHFETNQTISGYATYGYRFPAAFEHKNIFGVQFHPEKSHIFGMQLMKNFSKI